jgi:hypothetical protein
MLVARLQAWQVSVQAVPQQTPSAQNALAHWFGLVQAAPRARLARQMFWSQKKPVWQLPSTVQLAPHDVPMQVPPPGQVREAPAWQVPAPSQVLAANSVVPWQRPAAHSVLAAYRRQPPVPLQVPSRWHMATGSWGQSLPGSSPAATIVQRPSLPLALQRWQVPAQADSQQTPSTH